MNQNINTDIAPDIECLGEIESNYTLVSTHGYHSNVWESKSGSGIHGGLVIKIYLHPVSSGEIRVLQKNYLELKKNLGDMVPDAVFVSTKVNDKKNVIAITHKIPVWFNIANPVNEEILIPLLQKMPKARHDLIHFIKCAKSWYESKDMKIIDLWGLDNLVMDTNHNIRYLDSFWVFFYGDTSHVISDDTYNSSQRFNISFKRMEYIEYVLSQSG